MFWQLSGLGAALTLCMPHTGFEGGWVVLPALAVLGLLANIMCLLGWKPWRDVLGAGIAPQQAPVGAEMSTMTPAEMDAGHQLQVTVPPGMRPGQQLQVSNPHAGGKLLTVTIPAGVGEGQAFLVTKTVQSL